MTLILASASEMRQKLLTQIGISPDKIFPCDIDETPQLKEMPRHYAIRMACEKAMMAQQTFSNDYILAGDTVVACGRRILGKPANRNEAHTYLKLLSGRAHRCYSALCLINPDGRISQKVKLSRIIFKPLSEDEINFYLKSDEWQGRAGGYHIYGMAQRFIRNINGSSSAVAGLSLYEASQLLRGAGLLPK